ncbi:MAG: GntR family transcriptional regulator [bacterium]|nr:GntR family transcriptional regulator [bacterium]
MIQELGRDPIPKYHRFRLLVEQDIRKGKYPFGSALPPERKLAEDYGINRQTVRQALKTLEEEGYLLREQGRGTFVARKDIEHPVDLINIGVVIYKAALEAQWFFPDLLRGISDAVEVDSANVVIVPFDEQTSGVQEGDFCRRIITQKKLQGLLIVSEELAERELFYLLAHDFPFVLTRIPPYRDKPIDYVCYDHEGGMKQVISYLARLGHKKIACIGGMYSRYYAALRVILAFRQAMAEHGLEVRSDWMPECDYSGKSSLKLSRQLLSADDRPTAVILADDSFAIGVYQAAAENGLNVPNDLSVTGYNDLPIATALVPALTTVKTPRYEMGQLACEILEKKILAARDGHACDFESVRESEVELVIRDSCAQYSK